MSIHGLSDGPAFARLGDVECWPLLESRSFGRICFSVDDRVEVVPSAYLVRGGALYFRAAAYGPVARRVQTRPVTLQVDDLQGDRQALWSVTVTGSSRVVDDAATLAALWSPVRPHLWETGTEPLWVALTADVVQGQTMRPRDQTTF